MRGAGDELRIGERIRFYRRRRGLTQRQLSVMAGLSEETVGAIERGRREPSRKAVARFAQALRVSVPDLEGSPPLFESDDQHGDDVPAVRDALMSPHRLSRVLFRSPTDGDVPDAARTARYVEQVWAEYQAGRVGRVVSVLSGLIATAQALEDAPGPTARGWAVSARIHHLASTTLTKVGEHDLAWIAAERAICAAERSGDPLALASAARAGTHAFLANGRFDDAVELGATAAQWLRERMDVGDPAALTLFGMLQLRIAVAAARKRDRRAAADFLKAAEDAAERVGEDVDHWQTMFGPTNVMLHRMSVALDLEDAAYVVDVAARVDASHLPGERQATHLVDTARALTMVARDDDALAALLDAEGIAPQLVRHCPRARETVKLLYRRHPVSGGRASSPLLALAQRCRAVA